MMQWIVVAVVWSAFEVLMGKPILATAVGRLLESVMRGDKYPASNIWVVRRIPGPFNGWTFGEVALVGSVHAGQISRHWHMEEHVRQYRRYSSLGFAAIWLFGFAFNLLINLPKLVTNGPSWWVYVSYRMIWLEREADRASGWRFDS